MFALQVKLIRNLEFRDAEYKIELDEIEKLFQIEDRNSSGMIQPIIE